jgi:phage tail sheath protein FI
MAFQVSPGVNVSEIDLTTIVPAVSSSTAAIAGNFNWGPVEYPILVSTEDQLVQTFGQPNANNFETFFTAADFLSYGNSLYVSRAQSLGVSNNAVANSSAAASTGNSANGSFLTVKNIDDYNANSWGASANVQYIAKYPGALGNSLKISICDSNTAYSSFVYGGNTGVTGATTGNVVITFTTGSNVATMTAESSSNTLSANIISTVINSLAIGDYLLVGNASLYGTQYIQFNGNSAVTQSAANSVSANLILTTNYTLSTTSTIYANTSSQVALNRYWEFFNKVNGAPGTTNYALAAGGVGDELHVVVVDKNGVFNIGGATNTILEVFQGLSSATDAYSDTGTSLYVKNVLNNSSKYVWYGPADRNTHYSKTVAQTTYSSSTPLTLQFGGGFEANSEANITLGDKARALDKFASSQDIDISLILNGKSATSSAVTANYIIDNICEKRKDCVVFVSPDNSLVNNVNPLAQIQAFISNLHASSYAVVDSGYKYRYDKYNDVYRYTPLNGDVAGSCARTDNIRDPWWSPAGFNRGQIKNIVRPAFNPNQAQRDVLYKASVNPVVTFPGQGTILYGDKTFLNKPSAFDRINVRRLFIVLEKAIATASKFTLFEFNDAFTRSQFKNLVEPYLRDVQGRRGIYDFRVICDETNNTPQVIDSNQFVGDIYIKPARSINFIQLNFVAVRSGVQFEEIVGRF